LRVRKAALGGLARRAALAAGLALAVAVAVATPAGAATETLDRYSGGDRIATAIAASQGLFDGAATSGAAGAVVLARSDLFPDGLAGIPLAQQVDGPLLLTPPSALDSRTEAEIQRILPVGRTVYVLGSTGALSAAVANRLASDGYVVQRLAGADRFATAVAVANQLGARGNTLIVLATGRNYPDALAGGPYAGAFGGVVLLTNDTVLPSSVSGYITSHPSAYVVTVGAQASTAYPAADSKRYGADRYATAASVATLFVESGEPSYVGLASGANFPDALSGGAFMALTGYPLLLTPPSSLSAATQSFLSAQSAAVTGGAVFGGPSVVSESTRLSALAAIQ
jgi:putative cell wall-binding protein